MVNWLKSTRFFRSFLLTQKFWVKNIIFGEIFYLRSMSSGGLSKTMVAQKTPEGESTRSMTTCRFLVEISAAGFSPRDQGSIL